MVKYVIYDGKQAKRAWLSRVESKRSVLCAVNCSLTHSEDEFISTQRARINAHTQFGLLRASSVEMRSNEQRCDCRVYACEMRCEAERGGEECVELFKHIN